MIRSSHQPRTQLHVLLDHLGPPLQLVMAQGLELKDVAA